MGWHCLGQASLVGDVPCALPPPSCSFSVQLWAVSRVTKKPGKPSGQSNPLHLMAPRGLRTGILSSWDFISHPATGLLLEDPGAGQEGRVVSYRPSH